MRYLCCQRGGTCRGGLGRPTVCRRGDSGLDIDVLTTSCLNMCDTPLSFALQGPQKATYLFTGVDPEADTQDMLALLRLYSDAHDGWIIEAQAAGRLRLCLQGRVPKL